MPIMVGIEPSPDRLIRALRAISTCSTTVATAVGECADALAAISAEIADEQARPDANDP